MNYNTPGVYVEESDSFPMSLAALSTAVPAFVGCTSRVPVEGGSSDLVAIKLSSLTEYISLFGTAPNEPLNVTFDKEHPPRVELQADNNKLSQLMYYNLQMFFNNGGGTCYVVSLGTDSSANKTDNYEGALKALEKKPDITLIVLTDAGYFLSVENAATVYNTALQQCEMLQNRFVIMDTPFVEVENFKESLGSDFLKYGAAYTPYLNTSLNAVYNSPDEEENGAQNVEVMGVSCAITTAQFGVTYLGEDHSTYVDVIVPNDNADIEISTTFEGKGFTKPALTITAGSKHKVGDVIAEWKHVQDKNGFVLNSVDNESTSPVCRQASTRFTKNSYFCTVVEGLVLSYKGSAQAKPKVELIQGRPVGGEGFDVSVNNEVLTLVYEADKRAGELAKYFCTQFLNNKFHGFAIALENEGAAENPLDTKDIPLELTDFHSNNVEGLQISYVGPDQPTASIEIIGQEAGNTETDGTAKKVTKRLAKAKATALFDQISFEVKAKKITISCKAGTTTQQIVDKWGKESVQGRFSIELKASTGDKQIDSGETDANLWPVSNVISLKDLQAQNTLLASQALAAIDASKIDNFPPGGTIAGIYNRTDEQKGIWQSPANVSLNSVIAPTTAISAAQQANLNVDAKTGKSINAIRSFLGKGTLIWGARTLDGNSNDWRYISVRRLVSYIEATIKNGLQNYVFEANNAMTWLQVRAMIEPFLDDLWQQGALVGSKVDDAFFVNVGLGTTMTSQDILEGKMKVRIGLAAVRPAEFIILEVTQLQQS